MLIEGLKSVGLALLLSSASTYALAEASNGAGGAAAASTPEASGAPVAQLEEVVVTATRREESLQNVPVTVSAVNEKALENAGATDVRLLTFVVPGFVGNRNFGVLQPTLRGVGSSGNSPGDESNVAVYVDGIYQPHAIGNILEFPVVDRVEVLHGPQGTLFGRNATGGLVNVITPEPKFTNSGLVNLDYGNFHGANDVKVRGFLSGPLSSDVAGNFSVMYFRNDGYIDDVVRGGKLGDGESFNVRGKLLYQPTDRAQAILTVGYAEQNGGNSNIVEPLNGNVFSNSIPGTILAKTPYQAALSFVPKMSVNALTIAFRTKVDLGAFSVETSSGYLKDRVLQYSDTDGSPLVAASNRDEIHSDSQSHEIRFLSSSGGRLTWIGGAYYYHTTEDADVFPSISGRPPTFTTFSAVSLAPKVRVTALAAFAEGTYALTDALKLTVGGRYSSEDRHFTQTLNGAHPFPEQDASAGRWTYRGILQYQFSEHSNVYASYSTGFKSGVYNGYGFSAAPTLPETIGAIEIGVKSDPLPWLRTNASVFDYDYKNMQVVARAPSALGATSYVLENAANSKIRGVDLEAQALLPYGFSLNASAEYLDAKYKSFPGAQIYTPIILAPGAAPAGNLLTNADVSGNELPRAPKFTVSLGADWKHEFEKGVLAANLSWYRSAKLYYDFQERLNQPQYDRVNASVSWTMSHPDVKFTAYCHNCTDALIIQQATATTLVDQVTFELPREVGLMIEHRF